MERLVVNRLNYRLEHSHMLHGIQSGFRSKRCTVDGLLRLISHVHQGFQHKPHQRTVLVSLDLKSAYNRVSHLQLLDVFHDLGIPPVYGRFYKGFLRDRIFQVSWNGSFSHWAKESCGCPQGAVSSPTLFVIYVESLIRTLLPAAKAKGIFLSMYADDLQLWKSGYDIQHISNELNDLIKNHVDPGNKRYNMILSPDKCACFLFSLWYKDDDPKIQVYGKPIRHGMKMNPKALRVLGVYFDRMLTFCCHVKYICDKANCRMAQMSLLANSTFGVLQCDLRIMYITYIRSVLEYASPVWFPSLSRTELERVQRVQNKALRLALGVPRCTCIEDLHLEANCLPLLTRFEATTAFQAEKYRRYPPDDPLYCWAHSSLMPLRIKRSSWQYLSDDILLRCGLAPSRLSVHQPPPHLTLQSLHQRQSLHMTTAIAPWEYSDIDTFIEIIPEVPGLSKKHSAPSHCKLDALSFYASLSSIHDYAFWTDASVATIQVPGTCCNISPGTSVSIAYPCENGSTLR